MRHQDPLSRALEYLLYVPPSMPATTFSTERRTSNTHNTHTKKRQLFLADSLQPCPRSPQLSGGGGGSCSWLCCSPTLDVHWSIEHVHWRVKTAIRLSASPIKCHHVDGIFFCVFGLFWGPLPFSHTSCFPGTEWVHILTVWRRGGWEIVACLGGFSGGSGGSSVGWAAMGPLMGVPNVTRRI